MAGSGWASVFVDLGNAKVGNRVSPFPRLKTDIFTHTPLFFSSAQEKLSLQPLSSLIQFQKIPILRLSRTIPFNMAAAVLQPLQSLSINNEIMAPSPISPNASRHGRGRHGGSVAKGGKTRGRGYSIVDDRDGMISKALTWVLKRTIEEGEEQDEGEEKLVADSEGFVDCEELVRFPPPNNPTIH
jgi:hypothetical protein